MHIVKIECVYFCVYTLHTMISCIQKLFLCKQSKNEPPFTNISLGEANVYNTETYIPKITYGKVIKVYDGDTITVAAYLPESKTRVYKFSVRLRGIDSPEIKGASETEKKHAVESRDALSKQILDQYVEIKNVSTEKYGRLLADVYFKHIHLNEWMITNHFAVKYDGGKKQRDESWDK